MYLELGVYDVQKLDSRKEDFCGLVRKDLEDLKIDLSDEEIKKIYKATVEKICTYKNSKCSF